MIAHIESSSRPLTLACLLGAALALGACGDDGGGDDGGGDGVGDDGGDDGGSTDAAGCDTPATMEHNGHLVFEGAGPDTSIADGIRKITGELIIDGTDLADLDFLACLEEVGGKINVFKNNSLGSIGGLSGITDVANGEVIISENDNLTTIAGLSELASIGSLSINNNPSLQNVNGFSSLARIEQNLTIRYNDALTSLDGFSALTFVGNKFNVVGNSSLPCGNIAKLGDNLSPPPMEALWCDGNQGCDQIPACQ